MKLFERLNKEDILATWTTKDNMELSYYNGKVPAFTPAIQGQDSHMIPDSGIQHYTSLYNVLCNFEYTGWMDGCNSIVKTGYIGDWSWLVKVRITGRDVIKCLEQSTINGYRKFPIGKARHIVSVLPNGKMTGDGIAFVEIDGDLMEYILKPGQQIVVDTGNVAGFEPSVQMDIQTVPGVKNMLFGGEGIFNTVLTGPGRVWLQTMPIYNVANAIRPYIPTGNNG